ncbi:MAG: ribbon-helix-helix domain-containing protein [Spirochaetia bacterium]|nr:ribbon-helix-helix domain-containing protein [Spirochaetia bacterium]
MNSKTEVISFKADEDLAELLKKLPNKSDFIRNAVLEYMQNTCPLCRGTGLISIAQREHWNKFLRTHSVIECNECHELYIKCDKEKNSL